MELKNCPFCGYPAELREVDTTGCYDRYIKYEYTIGCIDIDCFASSGNIFYDSEEEAIKE